MEPLRSEWEELTDRATRAAREIREQLVAEEALSEEVVAVADWAETLEQFLHKKKMKPTDNRRQLREVELTPSHPNIPLTPPPSPPTFPLHSYETVVYTFIPYSCCTLSCINFSSIDFLVCFIRRHYSLFLSFWV